MYSKEPSLQHCQDILQEVPNIDGLVWLGYLMHVLQDISASRTRINLPIAALKPCFKADSFEYNKPYLRIFVPLLLGTESIVSENDDIQNQFFEDFDPISGFYINSHIDFHSKYNHKCQSLTFTMPYPPCHCVILPVLLPGLLKLLLSEQHFITNCTRTTFLPPSFQLLHLKV